MLDWAVSICLTEMDCHLGCKPAPWSVQEPCVCVEQVGGLGPGEEIVGLCLLPLSEFLG